MDIRNCAGERLRGLSSAVNARIKQFFCAFGKFVARWPWLSILLPFAISAYLGIHGMMFNFAEETNPAQLYAEQGSPSIGDRTFLTDNYGYPPLEERMLIASKRSGYPNLLKPDTIKGNLMEFMAIWEKLESLSIPKSMSDFPTLCERAAIGKPCKVESILSAWNYSMEILENDPDPLATINAAELTLKNTYGHSVDLSFVLGGIERNEKGEIIAGRAFNVRFGIRLNMEAFEKAMFDSMRAAGAFKEKEPELREIQDLLDKDFDPRGIEFDIYMIKEMNGWGKFKGANLEATIWNPFEVDRQSSAAVDTNRVWILLSAALVGIYSHIVMFRNNWTHCKAHLVIVSFIAIGMALVSAIGLALLIGVKYNMVVSSIPFLLMGLGIDDTFIIVGQFRRTDESLDPGDRIGQAMSRAGASIFVTSFTNLIAFTLAIASRIPAMRAFGVFASLGIVFNFFYQVTFFLAFVTFEARREHHMVTGGPFCGFGKRGSVSRPSDSEGSETIKSAELVSDIETAENMDRDNRPPQTSTVPPEPVTYHTPTSISLSYATPPPSEATLPPHLSKICGKGLFDPNRPPFSTRLFAQWIPRVTLSKPGRFAVLLTELIFIGIAVYGCTQVYMDFQFRDWFTPEGSRMHDAFEMEERFFFGDQNDLGVYTRKGDYFGNQDEMLDVLGVVRDNPLVAKVPRPTSWYEDYLTWLGDSDHNSDLIDNRPPNQTAFMSWLNEYLSTPYGSYYLDQIKFTNDSSDILSTKLVNAYSVDINTGDLAVEMMDSLRHAVSENLPELDPMVSQLMFPFYDGLRVIKRETLHNVVYAGAAVFVVCSITLANVVAAGIVVLMIALTDVMLFGFLWYVGLTFNMVTSINIVLAVGVAVDYSAHIMHSFLSEQGTRKERAQKALEVIGGEVFSGGFTTLLAVIGLAPSNHYILNVFFEMFMAIVLFGLWHGLVVLPVVLSYIGPEPYIDNDQTDQQDQTDLERPN